MKTLKKNFVITILSIFVISCSKPEDGAIGPVGPAGTANVIYSDWTTTVFMDDSGWKSSINAPKITQDVLDRGTVLMYVKNPAITPSDVVALNYTQGSTYIIFGSVIGKINLYASSDFSTYSYRYIIIPGGVSASSKTATADFQKMSYSEVCKTLNIPE